MKAAMLLPLVCLLISGANGQFFFGVPEDEEETLTPRPCFVPTGQISLCVPLERCPYVSDLLKNLQRPLPGDVAILFKDSFFCPKTEEVPTTEICCPFESIDSPPIPELAKPAIPDKGECVLQSGEPSSCAAYNLCSPFLQLLSNLRRPVPSTLPKLMRSSWLCGVEQVSGLTVPKVCCPTAAVIKQNVEPVVTTTESTTESIEVTTTPEPTAAQKFAAHPNREALAPTASCGVPMANSRIVNGEEAGIGEFPWLANLGYVTAGNTNVDWKCGGALIGDRYVLTAAHCVTQLPGSFELSKVRLGEHKLSTDPDCSDTLCNDSPQDFDIEEIIFHESYNSPQVFRNDIALLRLSGPVNQTDFVHPICLPFDHDPEDTYIESTAEQGLDIFVSGWGATNERGRNPADALQKLLVPVFPGDKCKDVYAKRGGILDPLAQMCAGGEEGRDSCVGDSGSALMREEKPEEIGKPRQFKLIGVVSFGPRLCGTKGVPGVYSKVRHYIDWILDHVDPN